MLPVMEGVIRRRLLINFRVDPAVVQSLLPAGLRPKLHDGSAIAGICLIRLEQERPRALPAFMGFSSENAAHRIAVEWDGGQGVYIPRRDTTSLLARDAGGRVFPGEHHAADFDVQDSGDRIQLSMRARDDSARVEVRAAVVEQLAASSRFGSLDEASRFFEAGSVGYSPTANGADLEGLQLVTSSWEVRPLDVEHVESSFFATLPRGSVEFDCGLLMRDVPHQWRALPSRTRVASQSSAPASS